MTDWHWLIRLRRMLGLFSFFYAGLHFLSFIGFDHAFVIGDMARDVIKRPFVAAISLPSCSLIPLAATSNQWSRANWAARAGRSCIGTSYLISIHGLRALFLAGQGRRVALPLASFSLAVGFAARLADS